MKNINFEANNFEPNILFLKDYIITYNNEKTYIYNLFGELRSISSILEGKKISNLHDNEIIAYKDYKFISYLINDGNLLNILSYKFINKILDIIYLNKYNFLIVNLGNMIQLYDYSNIEKGYLQIILQKKDKFQHLKIFKWNDDMFIGYNKFFIILFQKVNNSFQISSKFNLKEKKEKLIKFDKNTLIVQTNKKIYSFNINTMKISLIFENNSKIDYVKKIKKYIHIYINNILYSYKFKGNLRIVKSIEQDELTTINYLTNLSFKKELPLLNHISFNLLKKKNRP